MAKDAAVITQAAVIMYKVPSTSCKILFFTKDVLQTYILGMFANLAMLRGCDTVHCFLG